MSDTVKRMKFCNEDMEGKSVSEIPGVGPTVAKRLKSMDYTKATDVYKKLTKLHFNEKLFLAWMKETCKGAHGTTIYNALMSWHCQYGDQQANDAGSSSTGDSRVRPPKSHGGKRSATPKKKKVSVQFALPPGNHNPMDENHQKSTQDSLSSYLMSYSDVCRNIPQELDMEFRLDILKIMKKYDKKSKELSMANELFF